MHHDAIEEKHIKCMYCRTIKTTQLSLKCDQINCEYIIHMHTLCASCGLCGPLFRYFDKYARHSFMGECYPIFIGFWGHVLLWKGVASGNLQWSSLLQFNFDAIPRSIPIIVLSFVYQNVVPVLCTNLEGNLSKVRTAVVFGTAIPLVLFLVWDAVILGTIPNLDHSGIITDPLEQLRSNNGVVGPIVEVFSFFAIATSYIGFVLGLTDFVSDLLKLPSGQSKPLPFFLTLFPPLVLSLLDPEIFFKALDFTGTYGDLVLFGILPAAMSWSERYLGLETPQAPVTPPDCSWRQIHFICCYRRCPVCHLIGVIKGYHATVGAMHVYSTDTS